MHICTTKFSVQCFDWPELKHGFAAHSKSTMRSPNELSSTQLPALDPVQESSHEDSFILLRCCRSDTALAISDHRHAAEEYINSCDESVLRGVMSRDLSGCEYTGQSSFHGNILTPCRLTAMPIGSSGYHINPIQIEETSACYTETSTRMPFYIDILFLRSFFVLFKGLTYDAMDGAIPWH